MRLLIILTFILFALPFNSFSQDRLITKGTVKSVADVNKLIYHRAYGKKIKGDLRCKCIALKLTGRAYNYSSFIVEFNNGRKIVEPVCRKGKYGEIILPANNVRNIWLQYSGMSPDRHETRFWIYNTTN
jgi:hypothetical protein